MRNPEKFSGKKNRLLLLLLIAFGVGIPIHALCADISFDLPDSLKVERVAYGIGKFHKKDCLIFELQIKNTSPNNFRYRMRIALKDGTSAGMLIPRKGKPPVLKSGQTEKIKLPFLDYARLPDGVFIVFTELEKL